MQEILLVVRTVPPDILRFCHNNDGDYNMYIWSQNGWKRDKTWDGRSSISEEELQYFIKTGTVYELHTAE